jgi:hypothetical protein
VALISYLSLIKAKVTLNREGVLQGAGSITDEEVRKIINDEVKKLIKVEWQHKCCENPALPDTRNYNLSQQ